MHSSSAFVLPTSPAGTRLRRTVFPHPRPPSPICMHHAPPSRPLRPALAAAAAALLLTAAAPVLPAPPPSSLSAAPSAAPSAARPPGPLVQDAGRVLTTGEASRLSARLSALEASTSLRLQVVSRGPGAPQAPGSVRWPSPAPRTVVIGVDPSAGTAFSFALGPDLPPALPPSFWQEAANRFGNAFYVRDHGLDAALFALVDAVDACANAAPPRICRAVPGVSDDQWTVSAVSAALAGAVAGAASRTGGKKFNASFVLLFSPLWSIFFVSFGVGPIASRGPGVELQLGTTVAAFAAVALAVWWWIPARFGPPGEDSAPDL